MLFSHALLTPSAAAMGGLGPELITNGSFSTDTAWTKGMTGTAGPATIAAGVASVPRVNGANYAYVSQFIVSSAAVHTLTFDVLVAGVAARIGTTALGTTFLNQTVAPGSHSFPFTLTGTDFHVSFFGSTNATTAQVDNVSIRRGV